MNRASQPGLSRPLREGATAQRGGPDRDVTVFELMMIPMALAATAAFSACLVVGVCTPVPPAAPEQPTRLQTTRAPLGSEFSLRDGETAVVGKSGLLVRFERVASDGRCSVGSTCPDDGDAVVVINLRQPPNEPASVDLHTRSGDASEAAYLHYSVRLVRLEPRPVGEQPVPLPHYVATLMVSAPQRGSWNSLGDIAH